MPKTDLRDTGDSYVLEADMPGFRKEEIKLSLEGDVLTIAAEHTAEKQNEEAPEKDGESGETLLMGDKVAPRKEYITEHANFNRVDSFEDKIG